jgi:glycosyltransferase involved in cell wall biosynthesis
MSTGHYTGSRSSMSGTEKLRLLFITHWASRLGGAEHSLLDLLEEASSRDDVVLVSAEEGSLFDRARTFGVPCISFPCSASLHNVRRGGLLLAMLRQWRGMLSFAGFVLRVRRYIAEVKPHVIHANVPKSHITLLLIRILGYRGVCCFHMREIFEKGSQPYRLYSLLFKPNRAHILAISSAVKSSLPPAMAQCATVIYNGVTIAPPRDYSAAAGGPPCFVYLGRVVPWKGCHALIEAFALVYQRYGEEAGTLDVIGDTLYWNQSYREELRALITYKRLESVCRLLDHVDDPIAALQRYDVFCIASDREPFGRAVAEAQGCGMPVIAFDDGGIAEIVERNVTGALVKAGDGEGFALAMARFIDNPALISRMGGAARKRAAKLFERQEQRRKIVDYLERLINYG